MKLILTIEYFTRWGERLIVLDDSGRENDMTYHGEGVWQAEVTHAQGDVTYRYAVVRDDGTRREECAPHCLHVERFVDRCRIWDEWRDENFRRLRGVKTPASTDAQGGSRLTCRSGRKLLSVHAEVVREGETVAVLGGSESLGDWSAHNAVPMRQVGATLWCTEIENADSAEYKYLIVNRRTHTVVAWEKGANRRVNNTQARAGECVVQAASGIRLHGRRVRAAGTAVPVFSLRSRCSWGVGDFEDLRLMVDWAERTSQRVLQLLPVNDTTLTGTWVDSYPYNACSVFALHPLYISPLHAGRLADAAAVKRFEEQAAALNRLPQVDYPAVMALKEEYMRLLFRQTWKQTADSAEYKAFAEANRDWLTPYAVYCYLRDVRYHTSDILAWEHDATCTPQVLKRYMAQDEVHFRCFEQFHLHRQLSAAADYARSRGITLKGDIAIGVASTGADVWQHPDLFNCGMQAGAPPDAFADAGQNWGFPTYNWRQMSRDGFAWWRRRLQKMAEYFDAYRIDHILGFFRIWELPHQHVRGLLGHFSPAMPLSPDEIQAAGVPFGDYLTRPRITARTLHEFFHEEADRVRTTYLEQTGDVWQLKPEVATQQQIETLVDETAAVRDGLMRLCEEVLFVADPWHVGLWHPRIDASKTWVYQELMPCERAAFDNLYNDFYYRRHNAFWRGEALQRLPSLVGATTMLPCGEDLGMIPDCVAPVMRELGILSLEIERMPKRPGDEFASVPDYPYSSVCSTSTHDMPTVRQWWEEMPVEQRQRYYNFILGQHGAAPATCEASVCRRILQRHLQSPSMLTILPLQDWLSINPSLRLQHAADERINVPAERNHYWRYRMHLDLERLLKTEDFNEAVRDAIRAGGRC